MPNNRYAGDPSRLFKAAPVTPTDVLPTQFDIGDGASWLHAVADASARHRVNGGPEGGSYFSIEPAGSQQELADQIARVALAFEQGEGHPPSDRDDNFWTVVNQLIDAYDGPELGSLADIMGGLS